MRYYIAVTYSTQTHIYRCIVVLYQAIYTYIYILNIDIYPLRHVSLCIQLPTLEVIKYETHLQWSDTARNDIIAGCWTYRHFLKAMTLALTSTYSVWRTRVSRNTWCCTMEGRTSPLVNGFVLSLGIVSKCRGSHTVIYIYMYICKVYLFWSNREVN